MFGFEVSAGNESGAAYLMLAPGEKEDISLIQYQVEMIANNRIPGLLAMDARRVDDRTGLFYFTGGLLPLDRCLGKKKIGREGFLYLVFRLAGILSDCKKYLLDESSFVLDARYIYVDEGMKDIALLYIPAETGQDIRFSLENLLSGLIGQVLKNGGRDQAMESFLGSLCGKGVSPADLQGFLKKMYVGREGLRTLPGISRRPAAGVRTAPPAIQTSGSIPPSGNNKSAGAPSPAKKEPGFQGDRRTIALGAVALIVLFMAGLSLIKDGVRPASGVLYAVGAALAALVSAGAVFFVFIRAKKAPGGVEKDPVPPALPPEPGVEARETGRFHRPFSPGPGLFFGGQPAPAGDVVSLTPKKVELTLQRDAEAPAPPKSPYLEIRTEGNKERVDINKQEFLIGRNRALVDYFQSNKMLGRVHAKIVKGDGGFYLVDLGSKNGTFLNGERLEMNIPTLLSNRDRFIIAGVEYIFNEG